MSRSVVRVTLDGTWARTDTTGSDVYGFRKTLASHSAGEPMFEHTKRVFVPGEGYVERKRFGHVQFRMFRVRPGDEPGLREGLFHAEVFVRTAGLYDKRCRRQAIARGKRALNELLVDLTCRQPVLVYERATVEYA